MTRRRTTTRRRPSREIERPAKRWLFCHPSWLHDARKHGYRWFSQAIANEELARLITGVFCVFVETPSGADSVRHYGAMKAGCHSLGWEFVPGLRFGHQRKSEWQKLLAASEHAKIIKQTKDWPSLCLDLEPYFWNLQADGKARKKKIPGPRYHTGGQAYELFEAAAPWEKFRRKLFVYPPQFQAPTSILRRHPRAGAMIEQSNALDHSTYNANRFGRGLHQVMDLRHHYYQGLGVEYCPGFYLRYLNDQRVMALAEQYGQCWFYPSSRGDDRKRFMTPEWSPQKP
jgi:hypothetical protein